MKLIFVVSLFISFNISLQWTCTDSEWICDTIVAAGELADEKERYAALEELRQRLENDTEIAIELDNLLPIVDKWANGLEKYWSNETDQLTGLLEKTITNMYPSSSFHFKERMGTLGDGSCF